jgi:hypothetical protein
MTRPDSVTAGEAAAAELDAVRPSQVRSIYWDFAKLRHATRFLNASSKAKVLRND